MYNVKKTVIVHHEKQYKFYNHNLSSLFNGLMVSIVTPFQLGVLA